MEICGYLIVRKPAENYDSSSSGGIWPQQPPKVADIYYGGVWRMRWCDIDFDRYNDKLPPEIRGLYSTNVSDNIGSGLALCGRLCVAQQLLEYCNRQGSKCEIIAIYSPTFAKTIGTFTVVDEPLKHCGWEPFQLGGDSVLLQGLYAASHLFPTWLEKINAHGLLASPEDAMQYGFRYLQLVGSGKVEELFPVDNNPIELIEVYSLTGRPLGG